MTDNKVSAHMKKQNSLGVTLAYNRGDRTKW